MKHYGPTARWITLMSDNTLTPMLLESMRVEDASEARKEQSGATRTAQVNNLVRHRRLLIAEVDRLRKSVENSSHACRVLANGMSMTETLVADYNAATSRIAELEQELSEGEERWALSAITLKQSDETRNLMAALLNNIAKELKGDPPPLVLHDWSDLPERARDVVGRIIAIEEDLDDWKDDCITAAKDAADESKELRAELAKAHAQIKDLEQECDRLTEHSQMLNTIGWRIATVLGDVPEGAEQIEGNPVDQADRLIAEVVRLRAELPTYRPQMCLACGQEERFSEATGFCAECLDNCHESHPGHECRVCTGDLKEGITS